MWTHSSWLSDKKWHTVYYKGFMPIHTWRQAAIHLGIDSVPEYIKFLREGYPSVRFRTLLSLDGELLGLSIDFQDEDDARRLAEFCNERSVGDDRR